MTVKDVGRMFRDMMEVVMLWYSGCCGEMQVSDGSRRGFALIYSRLVLKVWMRREYGMNETGVVVVCGTVIY
jgi:hypothetical protein